MSARDWTPGPWTMRGESVMAHRRHVCGGYNEESVQALSRPPAERLANARLIAAAPALYEALADLVGLAAYAMQRANRDGAEYDIPGELTAARAALAQAEGGAA